MAAKRSLGLVGLSLAASLLLVEAARPQPLDWLIVSNPKACGASRGGVMIGSPDGKQYGLIVSGVAVGDQALRSISLDGKPFMLRFAQAGEAAFAELDASVMGAMAASSHLTIDWTGKTLDVSLSDLMPALNKVQACGSELQTKRGAEQERQAKATERRSRFRAFLGSIRPADPDSFGPPAVPGAMTAAGAPTQSTALAGTTCFKSREWSSGLNKNCAYNCMGSEAVQTIGVAELCPITIRSPR